MKAFYIRRPNCVSCMDGDSSMPDNFTCRDCERIRNECAEMVEIIQLGVGLFGDKAVIKRPDGFLYTVLVKNLKIQGENDNE